MLLVGLGTGCSGSGPSCAAVTSPALLSSINAKTASAVDAGHKLGNNAGFYVATPTGGVWATSIPPTVDTSGLTFPMNDEARKESDSGVDVSASAPILVGFSATADEAKKAASCTTK